MVGFVKHVFLEQFDFMLQVYLSHVLSWEGVHGRGAWTVQQCISAACCCSMFFFSVFSRRLHFDGGMPCIEGANGGCAVCMEATVREPLRCFAVFELKPPWGDTTNHGGGWVVGETHREGFVLTVCRKWHATCGKESDQLSSCELGINSRSDERS